MWEASGPVGAGSPVFRQSRLTSIILVETRATAHRRSFASDELDEEEKETTRAHRAYLFRHEKNGPSLEG
jgi:hypothetical protein